MAYRFTGSTVDVEFNIAPFNGYTFGAHTFAAFFKRSSVAATAFPIYSMDSGAGDKVYMQLTPNPGLVRGNTSTGTQTVNSTSLWYLVVATGPGGTTVSRFHVYDGTSWVHAAGSGSAFDKAYISSDRLFVSPPGFLPFLGDIVCVGMKKSDSTDLAVETLTQTAFSTWKAFGFNWLIGFDTSFVSGGKLQDQAGAGHEIARSGSPATVGDPAGWSWALSTTWNGSSTVSLTDTVTTAGTNTGPSIVSWAWNFGDGGTSTLRNPTHNYTVAGTYTVSLTVTSSNGSHDTKTKTSYVVASAPVVNGSATVSLTATVTTTGHTVLPQLILVPRPPDSLVLVPVTRPLPALTLTLR